MGTAIADGVDMKGKADALIRTNEFAMITDLKTTASSSTSFSKLQHELRFVVKQLTRW